jgi:hypothetical protein
MVSASIRLALWNTLNAESSGARRCFTVTSGASCGSHAEQSTQAVGRLGNQGTKCVSHPNEKYRFVRVTHPEMRRRDIGCASPSSRLWLLTGVSYARR